MRSHAGLLRLSFGVLGASALWFAVNLVVPVGPQWMLWAFTPVATAVVAAVFWKLTGVAALRGPTRRFWRHLAVAATLVAGATVAQTAEVVRHPGRVGQYGNLVFYLLDSVAIIVIIYALYRLPLTTLTRSERVRVTLDSGTVMVGAAIFIWHFETRPSLGSGDGLALFVSAMLAVLALVVVLAVAKVVLSGKEFVDRSALRWLAFAIFFASTSALLQPLVPADRPYLQIIHVTLPLVMTCGAWAARQQRLAAEAGRWATAEQRPSSYSVLPYAAVAAVDALLLSAAVAEDHDDELAVVAGAVFLTALVVLRQMLAFRENGRLLTQLDHNATHDALTGLPNRVLLGQRLERALAAPDRRPVAVMLLDLDDFKEVNDTLGHDVGDALLVETARRLAACVRDRDTVARLGGDEFVAVLDGADPAEAGRVAERIVAALREHVTIDGHELPMRASIGIAGGHSGDDPAVLRRRADMAMYLAKDVAGSTYVHYDEEAADLPDNRVRLAEELAAAIDRDELFLLYQPIVGLDDGRLAGAEALVRWAHPRHGTLEPDAFVPIAERTGLIVPLGRWVFRAACRQLAAWADGGPPVLNVNLSARDLHEPELAGFVRDTLVTYGVPAGRIAVEVTETSALDDGQPTQTLAALRELGVRISLDDFGTGHSTLRLLHDCPVDEIKLDRSFTQAEPDGRPSVAAAVAHLARGLELTVVAEGIETAEQAERLRALGYRFGQGFLFARPLPPGELDRQPITVGG